MPVRCGRAMVIVLKKLSPGIAGIFFVVLGSCALRAQSQAVNVAKGRLQPQSLSPAEISASRAFAEGVAHEIEVTRSHHHQPLLARRRVSRQLLQETCTAAITNTTFPSPNLSDGLFFRASGAGLGLSGERIVDGDPTWPYLRRFEVAAWPAADSTAQNRTYWVGVRLLSGPIQHFLFQYITDDVEYLGQWKQHVAPECRHAAW